MKILLIIYNTSIPLPILNDVNASTKQKFIFPVFNHICLHVNIFDAPYHMPQKPNIQME